MIEWEDSAQPISKWEYLSGIETYSVIRCASVGWMIQNTESIKVLAPNMGGDERNVQVSGMIRIPARCVIKVTKIKEPSLTSRPETKLMPKLTPRTDRDHNLGNVSERGNAGVENKGVSSDME